MAGFIQGQSRSQATLFPESLDEYIAEEDSARLVDAFVDALDLDGLGLTHVSPETAGRPTYDPGELATLYTYGYLSQLRLRGGLEGECYRKLGGHSLDAQGPGGAPDRNHQGC